MMACGGLQRIGFGDHLHVFSTMSWWLKAAFVAHAGDADLGSTHNASVAQIERLDIGCLAGFCVWRSGPQVGNGSKAQPNEHKRKQCPKRYEEPQFVTEPAHIGYER